MKNRSFYQQNQNQSANESFMNEFEEIDVEKTAETLVKFGNNKQQFQSYIQKINSIILGEENLDVISNSNIRRVENFEPKASFYKSKPQI